MLCGGRAQYGPLSRLSVPHLALSSLPSAYHPPRFCRRIVAFLFWILVAFLSCPPCSLLPLLVAAARDCIIDRNSESSSGSSPSHRRVPAREIVAQSDLVASGLSTANSQEGGKSKMGRR